jgi:hypothetical protein
VNCTKEAAAKVQLPLLFADDFRFNLLKADPSAFLSFGLTSQEAPQSSLLLRQRLERRSKRPSLSLTIRSLEPESREEEAHWRISTYFKLSVETALRSGKPNRRGGCWVFIGRERARVVSEGTVVVTATIQVGVIAPPMGATLYASTTTIVAVSMVVILEVVFAVACSRWPRGDGANTLTYTTNPRLPVTQLFLSGIFRALFRTFVGIFHRQSAKQGH